LNSVVVHLSGPITKLWARLDGSYGPGYGPA
jgi:hypothetical protein